MRTVPLEDYDGYAEFYVRRIEDWLELANEPQHQAEGMTDLDNFCGSPRIKYQITNFEQRFWKIPPPQKRVKFTSSTVEK